MVGLQHQLHRDSPDSMLQYSVTAALLATLLEKHTSFPCRGDEGGRLLTHLAQLVTNAHAVTTLHETEGGDVSQVLSKLMLRCLA